MNPETFGLGFNLTKNGGYILDLRGDKPRFVGLIIPSHTRTGYTVCPMVRKSIVFSNAIPDNMKSPNKVKVWMLEHAVVWNARRRYGICNPVIGILGRVVGIVQLCQNLEFQIIVLQLVLAGVYFGMSGNMIISLLTKGVGCGLMIWGIFNCIMFFRKNRYGKY